MAICTILKKYLYYNKEYDNANFNDMSLDFWLLERLPYFVIHDDFKTHSIDLKDVENLVEYKWSARSSNGTPHTTYYFEKETDAMAFKLKFS